jgi:hypothetical protein
MEEILALSMYTGPLYVLYNAVLRGAPAVMVELLNAGHAAPADEARPVYGNRFETTLFVICSGITKLSRFTRVPPSRLLYRGLGGMLLPEQFWKDTKGMDYKGGVEFGLMSTTTERSIAVQYSGTRVKRGIVFEISAGRIDIGASISFLSQYSREEEFLVQPLSFVEVGEHNITSHTLILCREWSDLFFSWAGCRSTACGTNTAWSGQASQRLPAIQRRVQDELQSNILCGLQIIIFPLRLSVNQKGITVEQLIERRKVPQSIY